MAEVLRENGLGWDCHGFLTKLAHDGEPDPALVLPGGRLVLVKQVHSPLALTVSGPFPDGARPEADALVSAAPGVVLGIVTADCAPVLLADPARRIVGAAHAGWRGAHGGVLEAAVDAMVALGAERGAIRAAIGPTIAQASYQVDAGFRANVLAGDSAHADLFTPDNDDRFRFDLPAYVRRRLIGAGIARVGDSALDTYSDAARFHSFRRATHRGEATYGRQYSLIGIPAFPAA